MSVRRRKKKNSQPYCADCGVNTSRIGEWYMVTDAVWEQAWPGTPRIGTDYLHILCIGCLEQRLGRPLTAGDFTPVAVNRPCPTMSIRLISRVMAGPWADADEACNRMEALSLARIGKARDLRPAPLLYDRSQTAALLNCSVATLLRLEKARLLTAHKLFPNSPTGKTFYAATQVHALAGSEAAREDAADD
jgi:hypothetical protein